ncbi:putative membrane protein [Nocardia nova SH22a]|uniref:Putative membrane protein n=1 Tax=Nocardia nova SH22a TaxID=1415166 RepID=W5TK74_9NOCA|nr:putative membrane protein [Nocardia nova SH22a]
MTGVAGPYGERVSDTRSSAAPRTRRPTGVRADIACALAAAILVAVAFVVPRISTPHYRDSLYAAAAPIFGSWLPHLGWGTGPAIVIAVAVVLYGPKLAAALGWPRLLLSTWGTALAWAFSLAMIDGWQRGFAGRLTTTHEYLHEVGGVHDIPAMLRGFSGRILDYQPDSWTTHVSGHPPGALLTFVWLDRIGLGGGAWASTLCVLVGCSASVAVLVALRALGAENRARTAAPYLALAPAAIWLAVSADAFFAGVVAWAVAALAAGLGGARRGPLIVFVSGVLFGFGIYLNYGLVLMAVPAAAVALLRGVRAVWPAVLGVLAVVAAFTLSGFWWLDGYHLVVQRYYQGIATTRPVSYWIWGNLAATVCAIGLASAAALHRLPGALHIPTPAEIRAAPAAAFARWRTRADPAALLALAALTGLLLADLSGLSKAETERIWLPFDIWLIGGTALLPARTARAWLAVQAVGTLVLAHVLLTNW